MARLPKSPTAWRIRPEIYRAIPEIDQGLRAKIRSLIEGQLPWPLLLFGPAGTGKTCAALCLLDFAGGEYWTVPGLCADLIQAQQGRLEWCHQGRGGTIWPEQLWRRIARCPLMVLDEIGCREKVSDAHYEAVKEVSDRRHMHGKPLVAITNLSPGALGAAYDDRIASRLKAGTIVELAGKDRRL